MWYTDFFPNFFLSFYVVLGRQLPRFPVPAPFGLSRSRLGISGAVFNFQGAGGFPRRPGRAFRQVTGLPSSGGVYDTVCPIVCAVLQRGQCQVDVVKLSSNKLDSWPQFAHFISAKLVLPARTLDLNLSILAFIVASSLRYLRLSIILIMCVIVLISFSFI